MSPKRSSVTWALSVTVQRLTELSLKTRHQRQSFGNNLLTAGVWGLLFSFNLWLTAWWPFLSLVTNHWVIITVQSWLMLESQSSLSFTSITSIHWKISPGGIQQLGESRLYSSSNQAGFHLFGDRLQVRSLDRKEAAITDPKTRQWLGHQPRDFHSSVWWWQLLVT